LNAWRRGGQCRLSVIFIFLTWLVLASCGERQVNYPARQIPDDLLGNPVQIEAGEMLFKSKCASCHGKPSEGRSGRAAFFEPPAPDFTEDRYRTVDPAFLFWRIEVGKTVEPYLSRGSVMPAWSGLDEQEIWQMVAYMRDRAK